MHTQDKETLLTVAAAAMVFVCWALVSTADAEDAEREHRVYCEMIELWKADAAMNVAPEQRRGWPDYDKRNCQ